VNLVKNDVLNIEEFKKWSPEYAQAEFILEDGKYVCGWASRDVEVDVQRCQSR
jgi:leucyl-tRNA synthetase